MKFTVCEYHCPSRPPRNRVSENLIQILQWVFNSSQEQLREIRLSLPVQQPKGGKAQQAVFLIILFIDFSIVIKTVTTAGRGKIGNIIAKIQTFRSACECAPSSFFICFS